jgi:hypothetical protein
MAKLGDHPGFKAVQEHIARASGMPMEAAGAVLAKSSRGASPAAKRANPRLNRVKGKSKGSPESPDSSYMFKGK